MSKIKVGIVGYGNLGKGIEIGIKQHPDFELISIFTRRDPTTIQSDFRIESYENIFKFKNEIDVLLLAGGSQKDIPIQGPKLAQYFNTVDCFDNHTAIPDYFEKMDAITKRYKRVSTISVGWDPGLFSLNRILAQAILPKGDSYTFWGPGLSQGHSDVVRRVPGVKMGVQYTIPQKDIIEDIKAGKKVESSSSKAHCRQVYLVAEKDADKEKIEKQIINMPDYFLPYKTIVHFISEKEFFKKHQALPHGGSVLYQGHTSAEKNTIYEFHLKLDSNPEYTGAVAIAFARATHALYKAKSFGAKTILDIPIGMLSARSRVDLFKLI